MYFSVFISFGGPDEEAATRLNNFLKSSGVKTWFFPTHAIPGSKSSIAQCLLASESMNGSC